MPGENVDPRYRKALAEDRASGKYMPHTKTKAGDKTLYPPKKRAGPMSPPNDKRGVFKVPKGVIPVEDMAGNLFAADRGNRQKVLSQGYFRRVLPKTKRVE